MSIEYVEETPSDHEAAAPSERNGARVKLQEVPACTGETCK